MEEDYSNSIVEQINNLDKLMIGIYNNPDEVLSIVFDMHKIYTKYFE